MQAMETEIPARLAVALGVKGVSQANLARTIGVSRAAVNQFVQGNRLPSIVTFAAICRALDVSADFLLGATPDVKLPAAGKA